MVATEAADGRLSAQNRVVPFLKWPGGKRWLVNSHPELFPADFKNYHEPFLGSGAVFFWINPATAILSDANSALIEAYEAIKSNWRKVSALLKEHQKSHCQEHYYSMRDSQPETLHERAARFIYLNRTCWNGLYRVNREGRFNVPIGTKSSVLLETDDFEQAAARLRSTVLIAADFEERIDAAKRSDFVFLDPPYTVAHNLNGFLKYNETLFSWLDQVRLQRAVVRAVRRGVKVLILNANHDSVRRLYADFDDIQILKRNSVLAADSQRRGATEELAIRTW